MYLRWAARIVEGWAPIAAPIVARISAPIASGVTWQLRLPPSRDRSFPHTSGERHVSSRLTRLLITIIDRMACHVNMM